MGFSQWGLSPTNYKREVKVVLFVGATAGVIQIHSEYKIESNKK